MAGRLPHRRPGPLRPARSCSATPPCVRAASSWRRPPPGRRPGRSRLGRTRLLAARAGRPRDVDGPGRAGGTAAMQSPGRKPRSGNHGPEIRAEQRRKLPTGVLFEQARMLLCRPDGRSRGTRRRADGAGRRPAVDHAPRPAGAGRRRAGRGRTGAGSWQAPAIPSRLITTSARWPRSRDVRCARPYRRIVRFHLLPARIAIAETYRRRERRRCARALDDFAHDYPGRFRHPRLPGAAAAVGRPAGRGARGL